MGAEAALPNPLEPCLKGLLKRFATKFAFGAKPR